MIKDLKDIVDLSYKFAEIERDMLYPNRERPENDAEHTFQLALVAWHIMEKDKLPLDQETVFKIALAHDLVEVHAGDVPLWGKNGHDEKDSREKEAISVLERDFPKNKEMIDAIREYKERKSDEAIFVYAVDKLVPFIQQLNTGGAIWKKHGVTLEMVLDKLGEHSKLCPALTKYFEEGIEYFKENRERYLGNNL